MTRVFTVEVKMRISVMMYVTLLAETSPKPVPIYLAMLQTLPRVEDLA